MKRILIAAILLVFIGCTDRLNGCYVEQKCNDISVYNQVGGDMVTYVWWKNKIVWVKYDPTWQLTDSLVKVRYQQAENVFNCLKQMK